MRLNLNFESVAIIPPYRWYGTIICNILLF